MKGPVTQKVLVILKLQKSPGNFYFSEQIFYSDQSFAAPTNWLDLRYNDQINAMLTLYRITLAPARKPYRIGLLFTHNNGDLGEISVMDGTLFFLRGRLENFHKQILFLYAAPAGNKFFCDFVFLRTLYFLLAYNLFQCLHSLQTIYLKISPKSHIS